MFTHPSFIRLCRFKSFTEPGGGRSKLNRAMQAARKDRLIQSGNADYTVRKWKSGLHDNGVVNSNDEDIDMIVESIEAESMDD